MKKNQQNEELLYGKKKTLTLPSGYYAIIREQNGNDDDILSNSETAADLSNINIFLSSLILETDLPFARNKKLSKEDINKMLLRDKYFILFASRVHSMGPTVKFQFDWGEKNGGTREYTEDLNIYLWDYKEELPEEGEENYSKYRIQPYGPNPHDQVEITLSSGKQLRFNLLDGRAEQELLKVQNITRNSIFKARRLELLMDDSWTRVENFMFFSKKDMAELTKIIREKDPEFTGVSEIENPKTKEVIEFPIMRAEGFFYPEEI